MRRSDRPQRYRLRNFFCLSLLGGAVWFLTLRSDPQPIGVGRGVAHVAKLPTLSVATPSKGKADPAAHRTAMRLQVMMLKKSIGKLSNHPGYTAKFSKQELISGKMTKVQVMDLKLRHAPFSIYMKWLTGDKGREVIYVDGENDGEMIVHPGGWKQKVVPSLKIDPNGSLALAEARHPITNAGMLNLAKRLLSEREIDLAESRNVDCWLVEGQKYANRRCHVFVNVFRDRDVYDVYRKSIVYLDQESMMPVCIRNYGWPQHDNEKKLTDRELDEKTLIESYAYSEIKFDRPLADRDFDQANAEYNFKR